MLLPTLKGTIWTHKTVVNSSQLLSGSPDFTFTSTVDGAQFHNATNLTLTTSSTNDLTGMTATVIAGTGLGETAVVQSASPNLKNIVFVSPGFTPTVPNGTSTIQFTQYNPYKDIMLFGIPANHIIVGVKIVTLTSFAAGNLGGTPNSVFVFVGDSSVFPASPSSTETVLVNNLNDTYGMSNLTIPTGSGDSYQYGSFRWFTFSGPGNTTYPFNRVSNQLGSPSSTYGSYCIPKRLDARDIVARFCILDYQDWQYSYPGNDFAATNQAKFESEWNFNTNVTAGSVEITVQYMSL
jgi:hypothetical protein